jgi:hypothetical protein
MNKTDVIVLMLGHKARAGKDTFADMLIENHPPRFEKLSFARKIKEIAADLYDLNSEQLDGALKEVQDTRYPNYRDHIRSDIHSTTEHLTPRRILQHIGADNRMIYGPVWAEYIFRLIDKKVKASNNTSYWYVITDFRFKNEYVSALKWADSTKDTNIRKHIVPIRIDRKDRDQISSPNDISEIDLDDFLDWRLKIDNNSSLNALKLQAKGLCDDLYHEYVINV